MGAKAEKYENTAVMTALWRAVEHEKGDRALVSDPHAQVVADTFLQPVHQERLRRASFVGALVDVVATRGQLVHNCFFL